MASRICFSLNHHLQSFHFSFLLLNQTHLHSKLSPFHSFSTLNSTCQIQLKHPPRDSAEGLEELLKEAQHRWFNAAEIHVVFANYEWQDMVITKQQEMPPSGSFFAIKRHMLREFKKDGHNWYKKKNGVTVQETYMRLKVENVETLQCVYVHGQDNENFQRRIYWMLDEEPSDIALFHYLEAKRSWKRPEHEKRDISEIFKNVERFSDQLWSGR